jgi:RNA polymerase sigma-32 factor
LRLSPREQDVIAARHMQETSVTLEDLSQKYNVSRERIRQIEARAMEKIQEYCSAFSLPA